MFESEIPFYEKFKFFKKCNTSFRRKKKLATKRIRYFYLWVLVSRNRRFLNDANAHIFLLQFFCDKTAPLNMGISFEQEYISADFNKYVKMIENFEAKTYCKYNSSFDLVPQIAALFWDLNCFWSLRFVGCSKYKILEHDVIRVFSSHINYKYLACNTKRHFVTNKTQYRQVIFLFMNPKKHFEFLHWKKKFIFH